MFARRRSRKFIAAADRARDRRDWANAAAAYAAALVQIPANAGIWVQYGHTLKEGGDLAAAERAYRRAIAVDPAHPDHHLQLGHVSKLMGKMDEAIAAYAQALRIDAAFQTARDELIHLGAAEALPGAAGGGLARARELANLHKALDRTAEDLAKWAAGAAVPAGEYDAFRRSYQIAPPPGPSERAVLVIVDASNALPAMIRKTLHSVIDQSHRQWSAQVRAPARLDDHPVASLARIDDRITLVDPENTSAEIPEASLVVLLEAGTILDTQALRWFVFAAARTTAPCLFADHDARLGDWAQGASHFAARLYGAMDSDFMAQLEEPPLVVAADRSIWKSAGPGRPLDDEFRRDLLLTAARTGAVAHIPRILSSRAVIPGSVLGGADDLPGQVVRPPASAPAQVAVAMCPLTVVIPTRDEARMLETCVDSLLLHAERPDLLDIRVVDNRSSEAASAALFARWRASGRVSLLTFDEPFNWSRANNMAMAAVPDTADRLLFLNNDTVMLTPGWDRVLHRSLARPEIGGLGAKLLYPDRTVQHGGVLFGMGRGSPIHEAVGVEATDPGPLGRWNCKRLVPATTGAFLACRRSDYDRVGGFDEIGLPIAFNDIDFCLKLRAIGLGILYDPVIQLIHHESKTRGLNDTVGKLLWDHDELEIFATRWGDEMREDPGYNPQWAKAGRPFSAFNEPALSLILDHLDRSARSRPWALAGRA
jgi:GT2 family glycosyltransferase/tetratricopeptide (TPR) repeat protein